MTPQLDTEGKLRHLLTLDGLSRAMLCSLLDRAGNIRDAAMGRTQKRSTLCGTTICTLFFEPSTRTRSSFQIAAQRLGADVINFDASTSSARKGETALDTLKNLEAMGVRGFIVRHPEDGAVQMLAEHAGEGTTLVNAGDGRSAHPSQGWLDALTLRQSKGPDFSRLKVLLVGDVKHSRVARSDLHALRTLGTGEIRVCGPRTLLPDDHTLEGCVTGDDFEAMLQGVDAVMMLRLQRERMEEEKDARRAKREVIQAQIAPTGMSKSKPFGRKTEQKYRPDDTPAAQGRSPSAGQSARANRIGLPPP